MVFITKEREQWKIKNMEKLKDAVKSCQPDVPYYIFYMMNETDAFDKSFFSNEERQEIKNLANDFRNRCKCK